MNLKIVFALLLVPAATVWADMFPKPYTNSFEKSSDVSADYSTNEAFYNVMRVKETSAMKASKGKYYATVPVNLVYEQPEKNIVRYGGFSGEWPRDGYTTSIDIFLDKAQNSFDAGTHLIEYSSAINKKSGLGVTTTHRRDFIFHVYTVSSLGNFIVAADNNSGAGNPNSGTGGPGGRPIACIITLTGWYTFRHYFHAKGDGTLEVVMSVLDAKGNVLGSVIRNDNLDVTATIIGGNRYGWFVTNRIPGLKIDNVTRSGGVIVKKKAECSSDGWKTVFKKDYGRFLNEKACTDYVKKGKLRL